MSVRGDLTTANMFSHNMQADFFVKVQFGDCYVLCFSHLHETTKRRSEEEKDEQGGRPAITITMPLTITRWKGCKRKSEKTDKLKATQNYLRL